MTFKPHFMTTHIGSVPHTDAEATAKALVSFLDIPAWPQLPRVSFHENMYVQYSDGLPNVILDEAGEKITFDTDGDLTAGMEKFYERYLAEDFDSFALTPEYSTGFAAMLDALRDAPGDWGKGQVTGPVSFGLTVVDQDLRAALYNEMLADAIVKNMAMKARWQAQQLKKVKPNTIIFVDEPYMASFGSAFISLSREQVITMLDEIFEAIAAEGALSGVHCCANTDWSVLLDTSVDILNIDAYEFVANIALYPVELRKFLDRGGIIAWGIVPNNKMINDHTPQDLAQRLIDGMELISQKAQARGVNIAPVDFYNQSLIMPACGLGTTTVEIADKVLGTLEPTAEILRQKCPS
jgi:hypothetical protein